MAGCLGQNAPGEAGDAGSGDGVPNSYAHVDFPASSPNALGCGGTRLVSNHSTNPWSISDETVWNNGPGNATGGGISSYYTLGYYQTKAHVPKSANPPHHFSGRGVPDVAGNADPITGYEILMDGQNIVVGGTSAVAPLWSGLIALINQRLGRPVGFVNPALYSLAGTNVFNGLTAAGNNGAYTATTDQPWNPCVGLGTPNGARLLAALTNAVSS